MQKIVSVIVRRVHVVRPKAASVVLSRVVVSSKFPRQRGGAAAGLVPGRLLSVLGTSFVQAQIQYQIVGKPDAPVHRRSNVRDWCSLCIWNSRDSVFRDSEGNVRRRYKA